MPAYIGYRHLYIFQVAILVDKWVASSSSNRLIMIFNVAILVDKWVASFAVFAKLNPINVAILADKKVNKCFIVGRTGLIPTNKYKIFNCAST